MKKLIIYFILLLLAVLIGLAISMHSGYVLIAYNSIVIESTLWVAIFFLLCAFGLLYLLLRSSSKIYRLPQTIANFLKHHRFAKAQRYFAKGLHRLLENDWAKAEDRFAQAIALQPKHNISLSTYLAAAYTANSQNLYQKRDHYLNCVQKIYGNNSKISFTIALTRLHLFLQNQQYEEALALICHLRQNYPHHKLLLQKLQLIYVQQQDWRNLQNLLPVLFRYKVLTKEQLLNLEKKVYLELWRVCLATNNEKKINHFWHKLSRHLRYDADFVYPYTHYLDANNNTKQAEKILLKVLNKQWQSKLAEHYGLLISTKPWAQLKIAEGWLKQHPQDVELLLAISRICQRQTLIGKAKYYLEQYLKYSSTPAVAYKELGILMEKAQDKDAALKFYRKALQQ